MGWNRSRWLCKAKVFHATEALANAAVTDMVERKQLNPGVLHAFKCDVCDGWHIGRIIKRGLKL